MFEDLKIRQHGAKTTPKKITHNDFAITNFLIQPHCEGIDGNHVSGPGQEHDSFRAEGL